MTLAARHLPLNQDRRVEIHALTGKDGGVVVAHRRVVDVPLADDACVVTGRAKQVRPGRGIVQPRLVHEARFLAVGHQAVRVGIEAGQVGRSARQAERIGDERLGEAHASLADAVEVGRLEDRVAVRAQRRLGVIVGHDEHDIRASLARLRRRHAAGKRERRGRAAEPLKY